MTKRVARVRIELRYTDPKIYRRIDVPLAFNLWSVHRVIQAAFGWDGDHLWAFSLGKKDQARLGLDFHFGWGPDEEETETLQLKTLVEWGVKRFHYMYDFGDSWDHIVTIQRVLDADSEVEYPHLVAGARSDAIEDIGGIWGFYRFMEAAQDRDHPDRDHFEEWLGEEFIQAFDHEHFDKELVQERLSGIS